MKAAAVEAPDGVAAVRPPRASARIVRDFAELVKARLTLLVLLTTAVGYYLGAPGAVGLAALFHVIFGTALAAAGAAALNQWWERVYDGLMRRTQDRPVPAGRMPPRDALLIGSVLSVAGVAYLWATGNGLSAALAAITIATYIFAYTPLKRISTTNTLVGAIPGALPPLIGWAAARGDLSVGGWSLFAILFFWQMPHFFAISWLYRDDYARAGFRMLSRDDETGRSTAWQSVLFAGFLLLASAGPFLLRLSNPNYLWTALLLSGLFLVAAMAFLFRRDHRRARLLFVGSIVYLPALLILLVATKS